MPVTAHRRGGAALLAVAMFLSVGPADAREGIPPAADMPGARDDTRMPATSRLDRAPTGAARGPEVPLTRVPATPRMLRAPATASPPHEVLPGNEQSPCPRDGQPKDQRLR